MSQPQSTRTSISRSRIPYTELVCAYRGLEYLKEGFVHTGLGRESTVTLKSQKLHWIPHSVPGLQIPRPLPPPDPKSHPRIPNPTPRMRTLSPEFNFLSPNRIQVCCCVCFQRHALLATPSPPHPTPTAVATPP